MPFRRRYTGESLFRLCLRCLVCGMGLLLLVSIWMPAVLQAQQGRLLWAELDTREAGGKHSVVPLGQDGLLVIYPSATRDESGNTAWIIQHYDINLVVRWRRLETLPGAALFIRGHYAEGKAVLLFQSQDGTLGRILAVQPGDGSVIPIEFSLEPRTEIHYFGPKGPWFLLGTYDRKQRLVPILVDRNGILTRLETGMDAEQWLDDALWVPEEERLVIAFKYRMSRRAHGVRIQAFGTDAKRAWEIDMAESNGRWHSAARLAPSSVASALIFGAFSLDERTGSYSGQSPAFESASGFFTAVVNDGKLVGETTYHPFSEFTNYFSHLSAQEVSRMRSTSREGSPSLDFRLLIHGLRLQGDEFVLAAEAYFEKYHYVSRMAYDLYGRPVPSSYTVFDGYQYTNTFIAGFDSMGVRRWDNNLEIRDKLVKELQQFVEVLPDEEDLIVAYVDDGRIASQAIRGRKLTAMFGYSPLEAPGPFQRTTEGEEEHIIHWYGRYALCSGYQKIRSLQSSGGDRRTVFFLNKVVYR